jgi:hypothetical protein
MRIFQSRLQATIRRFGATGFLLPISLLLLLGFFSLEQGHIFTLEAAGEAQIRSEAAAENDVFMPVISGDGTANGATGVVFRDYNANGARDAREPGVPGINVSAYDENGFKAASAITGTDGQYDHQYPRLFAAGSGWQ